MMLLDVRLAAAGEFALVGAACDQLVVLDYAGGCGGYVVWAGSVAVNGGIRMYVHAPVDPSAIPGTIVNDDNVIAPAKV